jgi:hypothetical protein
MALRLARIYVLFSASSILSGWFLSLLGSLSALGYGLTLPPIFLGLLFLFPSLPDGSREGFFLRLRRYKKPLPALFGIIALLCFIGGLLHAPNNYDFLTYRLSRLLHWHEAGTWHWIETFNPRMNYSGTNAEWLLSPILLFTQSDRFFFLVNWLAYLLMPACIFVVFRGMGVKSKSAWWGMWLVPMAYCFVAQAASVGNDLLGTTFFLFAMAFSIQARQTSSVSLLAISGLSIAICTGIKASNLPLILPWLLSILPCFEMFRRASGKMFLVIAACSFVPMAALNFHHTGNWKGTSPEDKDLEAGSVSAGLIGNTLQATIGALQPPALPMPAPINNRLEALIPASVQNFLAADFPRLQLRFVELPNEENAGLGLGVFGIVVLAFLFAILGRRGCKPIYRANSLTDYGRKGDSPIGLNLFGLMIYGGMIFSTGAYMALMGSESTARLLSPYYPVLAALPFGLIGMTRMLDEKVWRVIFLILASSAIVLPLTTPSRPLLPIPQLANYFSLPEKLTKRIDLVYETYSKRSDALSAIREALPTDSTNIGLICSVDDTEVSLWKPFRGRRHVTHVTDSEKIESVDIVIINTDALEKSNKPCLKYILQFLNENRDWSPSATFHITSKVQVGSQKWVAYQKNNYL